MVRRASEMAMGTLGGVAFGWGAMKLQRDTLKDDVEALKESRDECLRDRDQIKQRLAEIEAIVKIGPPRGQVQA